MESVIIKYNPDVCFVFPLLGDSLLKLIKHYKCKGIPIPIVKRLTVDVKADFYLGLKGSAVFTQ